VLRGGSWNNNPENAAPANRNRNHPDNRNNNIGFRLVCALTGPANSTGPPVDHGLLAQGAAGYGAGLPRLHLRVRQIQKLARPGG
jgi:hypothetical protein